MCTVARYGRLVKVFLTDGIGIHMSLHMPLTYLRAICVFGRGYASNFDTIAGSGKEENVPINIRHSNGKASICDLAGIE